MVTYSWRILGCSREHGNRTDPLDTDEANSLQLLSDTDISASLVDLIFGIAYELI